MRLWYERGRVRPRLVRWWCTRAQLYPYGCVNSCSLPLSPSPPRQPCLGSCQGRQVCAMEHRSVSAPCHHGSGVPADRNNGALPDRLARTHACQVARQPGWSRLFVWLSLVSGSTAGLSPSRRQAGTTDEVSLCAHPAWRPSALDIQLGQGI